MVGRIVRCRRLGLLLATTGCVHKGEPLGSNARVETTKAARRSDGSVATPVSAAEVDAPAAEQPSSAVEVATRDPAVAWESLQPIALVTLYGDHAHASVPESDQSLRKKYPGAYMNRAVRFGLKSPAVPARVHALADATWLLPGRVHAAPSVREFFYSASPFGDGWTAVFDWPLRNGERHPADATRGLALAAWPHTSASLSAPTEVREASGAPRRALVAGAPPAFRPGPQQAVKYVKVEARLPPPATQIFAGYWDDEDDGNPTYGVVISADEAGDYVETISKHRDYLMWASVSFVVDVDGDQLDELLWGHGGLEDEAYFLSHHAEGKWETVQLYGAGH